MNISEICEKYHIESKELSEIRKEILKLLKEIHPDNNNGECNKEDIADLTNALSMVEEEIDKKNLKQNEIQVLSNALSSILQDDFIVKVAEKTNEKREVEKKLENSIEEYIIHMKVKTRVRRYSSVGITAIVTFLWLFPEKLMSHPIFAIFFDDNNAGIFSFIFLYIWLILLIITVSYWLRIFSFEQIEREIFESMKLRSVQNKILTNFLADERYNEGGIFSKEKFSGYIREFINNMFMDNRLIRKCRYVLNNNLSEEIIQDIADIILLNAEEHKVVKKIENRSLMDYYEVITDF